MKFGNTKSFPLNKCTGDAESKTSFCQF